MSRIIILFGSISNASSKAGRECIELLQFQPVSISSESIRIMQEASPLHLQHSRGRASRSAASLTAPRLSFCRLSTGAKGRRMRSHDVHKDFAGTGFHRRPLSAPVTSTVPRSIPPAHPPAARLSGKLQVRHRRSRQGRGRAPERRLRVHIQLVVAKSHKRRARVH